MEEFDTYSSYGTDTNSVVQRGIEDTTQEQEEIAQNLSYKDMIKDDEKDKNKDVDIIVGAMLPRATTESDINTFYTTELDKYRNSLLVARLQRNSNFEDRTAILEYFNNFEETSRISLKELSDEELKQVAIEQNLMASNGVLNDSIKNKLEENVSSVTRAVAKSRMKKYLDDAKNGADSVKKRMNKNRKDRFGKTRRKRLDTSDEKLKGAINQTDSIKLSLTSEKRVKKMEDLYAQARSADRYFAESAAESAEEEQKIKDRADLIFNTNKYHMYSLERGHEEKMLASYIKNNADKLDVPQVEKEILRRANWIRKLIRNEITAQHYFLRRASSNPNTAKTFSPENLEPAIQDTIFEFDATLPKEKFRDAANDKARNKRVKEVEWSFDDDEILSDQQKSHMNEDLETRR